MSGTEATWNDNPRRRSRILAAILVGVMIALSAAIISVLQTDGGGTPVRATTAANRPQAPARPPIAHFSGRHITLSVGHSTAAINRGTVTLQANGGNGHAVTIIGPIGRAAFTITGSQFAPGISKVAYPSLYVGCHWGVCTANDPFPLQLSSIQPGQVTTSVTSVTPSTATGAWGEFYDIFITAGPHQSQGTTPREELEIWQNENNRGIGTPVVRGVNLDGRLYDIYLPQTKVPGTVAYVPETMSDSFSGDLLPFIQDSIRRGYAQPNWYLIDVEHGFEVAGGNLVGLGDSGFTVMGR